MSPSRSRDLDQTVIGNPAHDLIRLGLSLATAARSADLPGVITSHMMGALIDGYEQAIDPSRAARRRNWPMAGIRWWCNWHGCARSAPRAPS
jgi:uncharacterized protein (DUF2252 family)